MLIPPRPENYTKSLITTAGWVDETSGYIPHDLQFATMKVGMHLHSIFFVLALYTIVSLQLNSLQALNFIFGDFSMIKYYPVYHTKAQMSAKKTN